MQLIVVVLMLPQSPLDDAEQEGGSQTKKQPSVQRKCQGKHMVDRLNPQLVG